MKPYIYIRTLKHAEHTVFCVQEGQKAYFDPLFNRMVPYSSGQQIKRCILTTLTDDLNVPMAPITFNYNITKINEITNFLFLSSECYKRSNPHIARQPSIPLRAQRLQG